MTRPHGRGERTLAHSETRWLRIRFGSFRFYITLLIVAVGLHFFNSILGYIPFSESVPDKDLALEFQKKQLDIWAEMNKLLIALATVAIGGIGAVLLNRDPGSVIPPQHARRAVASWIFCAASLYFGYLSYHEATWMLSLGTFNSNNPRLWWPTHAQFWTFLVSVLLFADFAYGTLHDREPMKSM